MSISLTRAACKPVTIVKSGKHGVLLGREARFSRSVNCCNHFSGAVWLIPLRKPHVGGLTSGLTLVRKKRISRRFKSEECNLVKDTAHCVALLEIDFYALPTGEIFLSDGCGWDGMDLWRSLYHVNGVRCGEFRVKLTSRFVYSMRVIRLEFLSFFFFLVFYFILFMRFVALFFLFSKRILTRDSCKFLCHDRFYAIILVTYSKAIIDNYIFKSR